MASDKITAEMLNEIQSETASEFINSVLYATSPPGSTGLSGLDAHFVAPEHSPQTPSLNRGDVIEIQGPAASGKTQLVYHLTMKCVLPQDVLLTYAVGGSETPTRKLEIGGWGKGAVILDTDGRWNIRRLERLLSGHLRHMFPTDRTDYEPSIRHLVIQCLQRVHIFRPDSSISLAATLLKLPAYHAKQMLDLEIALLAIDSVSAFYWIDRYALEQQRSSERKEHLNPLKHVLAAIQELRLRYSPVTILTNWGLSPIPRGTSNPRGTQTSAPSPFYRQHLHPFPAPFEIPKRVLINAHLFPPITHHITLPLPLIPGIPAETASLEDARRAEISRIAIIKRGEAVGIIRTVEGGQFATFTFQVLEDEIVG